MFDFNAYLAKLNNEPQWLKDKRINAWQKFSDLPMPLGTEEDWRVLDLDLINLDFSENNFEAVTPTPRKLANLSELKEADALYKQITNYVEKPAGVLIESPNGMWYHLDEQFARQGVILTTLNEALIRHEELLKPYLNRDLVEVIGQPSDQVISEYSQSAKFALLNQALCTGGMFIYMPKNVILDRPFICLNLLNHSSTSLNMARLIVVAEQHSQLSLVNLLTKDTAIQAKNATNTESSTESSNGKKNKKQSLTNFLLQVYLQPGAEINYAEIQNFDNDAFSISHSYYVQEQDSRLQSLIAALGGGQLKSEVRNVLQGRGCESNLNGVILGGNNERFNFNTIEDHIAPDTKSNIDFRVALKDEAQSIYHGNIQVSKTAQKTNAFQSNKNLLLGEKAHADSIPKLEILADDVKCSHGATVGPVDCKQIFYLMSRGLSESEAEELIVNGFFHQLLADCQIQGVSDWLDLLVAEKIQSGRNAKTKELADKAQANLSKKQPALTR